MAERIVEQIARAVVCVETGAVEVLLFRYPEATEDPQDPFALIRRQVVALRKFADQLEASIDRVESGVDGMEVGEG